MPADSPAQPSSDPGPVVSATTVRDTEENVDRFVRRNLAAGIDHLVLFVDTQQPELIEAFVGSTQVTCVPAWDDTYWRTGRPRGLNARQNANASALNVALARLGTGGWLFHIDADEVVRLDRERLEALDPSVSVVHLDVLEAVSHEAAVSEGGWFKRRLSRRERGVLVERGLAAELSHRSYFHGHVAGKSGWRPSMSLRAGIHKPRTTEGAVVEGIRADWLTLLHFESVSADEFARKWLNLMSSGDSGIHVRRERLAVADGVRDLVARDLSSGQLRREMRSLYEEHVRDPFPGLRDLGYLVRLDPDERHYRPRELDPGVLTDLRLLLLQPR